MNLTSSILVLLVSSFVFLGCTKPQHVLRAYEIDAAVRRCELYKQDYSIVVDPTIGGVINIWCEPKNPRATFTFSSL